MIFFAILGPSPPFISLHYSETEELRASNFVQLLCLISGYLPESIGVSWQKDGKNIESGFTTTSPAQSANGRFSSASSLKVRREDWTSGSLYSCQVTHSATNSNKRKEIGPTSGEESRLIHRLAHVKHGHLIRQ